MWDEEDGFFYDLLRLPDGRAMRLKVRSLVGLLPLCATAVIEPDVVARFPKLPAMVAQFRDRYPELIAQVAPTDAGFVGHNGRRLLSILNAAQARARCSAYLLDENEFLGPHGIRSLSRHHLDHPFVFHVGGQDHEVQYLPAESDTGMFGGNSNWRGPVWMPVNALIVRALVNLLRLLRRRVHGRMPDRLRAPYDPVRGGPGDRAPADAHFPARRRRAAAGVRRDRARFQDDPHWRDLILFYEYFHGDNGAGLGASHQTGWTSLVAPMLDLFGRVDAKTLLEAERGSCSGKGRSGSRPAESLRKGS